MLKRKCEKIINEWIENDKKALMVYGARQVGKTYIIRHCVKNSKYRLIEFNLIQNKDVVTAISNSNNTDDLIMQLSLLTNEKIIIGETIIFFDEIQEYKEIVTKIKFLVDEGKLRYILSGSLLGVEIKNLKSAPIGYLKTFTMYPLDFEEFLQVYNVSEEIMELLKQSYENLEEVPEVINKKMIEIFNQYLVVGGMPQAVETFKETKNIDDVMNQHYDIINRYKEDFTKYEEENKKLLITNIYELIPAELNCKNKRFNFRSLNENYIYNRNQDNFLWLKNSGVAIPVFNTTEPVIPLLINKKSSLFKMFLSDVGILSTMFGKVAKFSILHSQDINNGAVYENAVAQELLSHGFNTYYYANKKYGEVDFVIEYNGKVIPIEVKSGKDYTKHSALNNVLSIYSHNIDEGIVLCNGNVKLIGKIKYLPIYMVMFFDNNKEINIKVDMNEFDFSLNGINNMYK